MVVKPYCNPCKKGLSQKEFKTDNFVINVCGNCEYKNGESI
jgi:hypothetical protein